LATERLKEVMDQNNLFAVGLGLSAPWKVVRSGLEEASEQGKVLYVDIDFEDGEKFPCPICGRRCSVYDSEVKQWRHMNFWQHATYLSARVPRVECPEHKVKQVEVPWARPQSGFTLMFEALIMALAREMPVAAIGALVGEHDTRMWRIVRHYVGRAHAAQDWSTIQAVAIDETATRKGHRYATVVVEVDLSAENPARLLFMTPDRTAGSVGEFVQEMPAHAASPPQVRIAAIDMSAAYQKGVTDYLPSAQVVFDRFHVMKLAGEAVDGVRKELRAQGLDLKGAMWALRGNWENLKQEQRELRLELCARHKALARAVALRESLQETWQWPGPMSAELHLKGWCAWASRSRLAPFQKLAKTIKNHWQGILAFFPHRVTSAAIEAINGIIQTARRRARGFRNFQNLKAIAYWMAGRLDLQIPSPFAHPI
jgi:transposase